MKAEHIITIFTIFTLLSDFSKGNLLKNVTNEVFGGISGPQGDLGDLLPVAFGDFNYDKFTDVFTINRARNKIRILLAKADELVSTHPSENTNGFQMVTDGKHLSCNFDSWKIESVIPADFDGNGAMDVLIVAKDEEDESQDLYAFVLWGELSEKTGKYELICESSRKHQRWTTADGNGKIKMKTQPIVVMYNDDYTADLFGSRSLNSNGTDKESNIEERGFWVFKQGQRSTLPDFVPLNSNSAGMNYPPIKRKYHSNAFIDVNNDGNADLLIFNENNVLEIWENSSVEKQSNVSFKHHKDIDILNKNEENYVMGQAAFADFDMNSHLDMIIPVFFNDTYQIIFGTLSDLYNGKEFLHIEYDSGTNWVFDLPDKDELHNSIYSPLTPRVGDVNLDGFPDILLRMKNKLLPDAEHRTQLFLNVPWSKSDDDPNALIGRGFLMQNEFMEGINSTEMATFFDLFEDGVPDIITVQKFQKEGVGNDVFRVGAFTNTTKSNDAYFVKVIILTGVCYRSTCFSNVFGDIDAKVPFGTNIPGQKICYRTEMLLGEKVETVKACASQLPQSAHSVLQLPYTIFGLGSSPNFVDSMLVNVTNSSHRSLSHSWTQIIPNSQFYVVPYPPNEPDQWKIMLFITPSHAIVIIALALLGVCVLTVMIIAILHWRERKQDLKEKLQDAQRFHFDAM